MSGGAWVMLLVLLTVIATLTMLLLAIARSIHNERTPTRGVWREFSLGLVLVILFIVTWIGQLVSEWQTFTDEQRALGQATGGGDFLAHFLQSTLENWQSEFLQLFSFVVLAALYIHKGSAESKDGTEKIEASLRRIEERLGTLPANAQREPGQTWKLPDTPLEDMDRTGASQPG